MSYSLVVAQPKALMPLLIDTFFPDTLISFEGMLKEFPIPEYVYATEVQSPLRRATISPETDFWVFRLDAATKQYLKEEFFEHIGLRGQVFHIMAAAGCAIVFESYDGFEHCFITLAHETPVSDKLLLEMQEQGIISAFERDG